MLVEAWLARAAAARPGHAAVEAADGRWSYAQLLVAAQLGAQELARAGVGPGEHVAIALPGGLAFAQALHACLLLGAVAVPLDVRAPAPERARLAAGSALVIEDALPAPAFEGSAFGESGAGGSGAGGSAARGSGARSSGARTLPEAAPRGGAGEAAHDLDAVAAVIHTSGTSAAPRAVQLTYGNFLWSALGSAAALDCDPCERWLCALPVCHVGGLSILIRSAIYATTAVIHERFDAERVNRALLREDVTLVSLVATTLARLLDGGLAAPPRLRCALTGGGPVPRALVARAHAAGIPVSLTYGLTEACSQVTTTPVRALGSGQPEPGPPLFCTRVQIAGAAEDSGARGAWGAGGASGAAGESGAREGEILVSGPTVAPGAPGSDGWLHTGDVGALDERGRLHVTGRVAELIISGGENVAPAEVEAALESHPEVLEAAVVGRAHEQWGEAVTAIVVAAPGRTPQAGALREHCARQLAPFKVPREILVRAQPLPRTASGKLLRRKL